jgi:polar amino acid transport system substrate-binding protein
MSVDRRIVSIFAPTAKLRSTINLGNPVLAYLDPTSGKPLGVSVDIANELGRRLEVDVEYQLFNTAGEAVNAVAKDLADIGFFAVDPLRGERIEFTTPYVLIDGSYLVREGSSIRLNGEVDQKDTVVVVGERSAYDLYLSRELKYARIVRAPTSPSVADLFIEIGGDVAAGVRQQLEADAKRFAGLRLLEGHFMVIQQAMGICKSRGREPAEFLNGFIEEIKRSNFLTQALSRHRIEQAVVAAPTS